MRAFRIAAACGFAVVVTDFLWGRFQFGSERVSLFVADLSPLPLTLFALLACWAAARRTEGRARLAWRLLGAAALSWGLGEVVWSVYELALAREVPFPSLADAGFLGMIPLAAAAMLSFPTAPERVTSQLRTLMDGSVLAGSVLFVSWATVLGPTIHASEGGPLERAIGVAYPLTDFALITIVLLVAMRARRHRGPLWLIASGLAALAFADSGFLWLTQNELYASGSLIDWGWNAGFVLIGLAGMRARVAPPPESAVAEGPTRAGTAIPYAAFFIAVGAAIGVQVVRGGLEPFLFWNAVAVILLLSVRTLLTALENVALTRNLERKVEARTADLHTAVRELEESRRLQDSFVSTVSHELRTPVTTLLGSTATMLRPELELDGSARMLAEGTRRAAERMSALVEDLLVASSLSDGIAFARAPFDVAAAVADALAAFVTVKEVRVDVPEGLRAIGDPARLSAVLSHLLDNADKFAPDGTTIAVEAAGDGDEIHVVVHDEGPGIPGALRERVFDRFYQADASRTRAHGGAGLGLYVARRLTEGMGGRLTVDDRSPGAALRITLPALSRVALEPHPRVG